MNVTASKNWLSRIRLNKLELLVYLSDSLLICINKVLLELSHAHPCIYTTVTELGSCNKDLVERLCLKYLLLDLLQKKFAKLQSRMKAGDNDLYCMTWYKYFSMFQTCSKDVEIFWIVTFNLSIKENATARKETYFTKVWQKNILLKKDTDLDST